MMPDIQAVNGLDGFSAGNVVFALAGALPGPGCGYGAGGGTGAGVGGTGVAGGRGVAAGPAAGAAARGDRGMSAFWTGIWVPCGGASGTGTLTSRIPFR